MPDVNTDDQNSLDAVTVPPIQLPVGARLVSTTVNPSIATSTQEPTVNLSLLNKIKSFTIAMVSKALQPEASRKQRNARLAVCQSCPSLEPTKDKGVGFCKACGCPKSKYSTVAFKAKIPRSTCPKNLWDAKLSLTVLPPSPAPPETEKVESVSS